MNSWRLWRFFLVLHISVLPRPCSILHIWIWLCYCWASPVPWKISRFVSRKRSWMGNLDRERWWFQWCVYFSVDEIWGSNLPGNFCWWIFTEKLEIMQLLGGVGFVDHDPCLLRSSLVNNIISGFYFHYFLSWRIIKGWQKISVKVAVTLGKDSGTWSCRSSGFGC